MKVYQLVSGLLVAATFAFLAEAAAVPETSSQWKLVTKVLDDCVSKEVGLKFLYF
jgi:hypothetical protein